jgi:TetR/AcrR family tetracycline transcriptional repressor
MPRPSSPLISHDAVVEASLRIIDREGLDAFSLPRLARELNVQTPSLYYHFRDRADILRTVARAIVLESRVPAPDACRTWVDWFTGISLSFRRAVLSHRNAAPILLEFMPRDVLIWNYELGVQILAAVGVPPEARIGVIDGLDTLTLGASLAEAARSPARAGQVFANVDADAEPMLADALAANTRTAEQLFADSIRSFLRGAVPGVPPDVPAPRALIARYRDTRAAAASHDGLDGSGLPAAQPVGEPGSKGIPPCSPRLSSSRCAVYASPVNHCSAPLPMTVVASSSTDRLATATASPAFMPASHAMASCSTSGDRSMYPPRPRQATFVDSRPETSAGAYQSGCWPPGGALPAAFHGSMRLMPMPVKSEVLRVASAAFRTRQIAAI